VSESEPAGHPAGAKEILTLKGHDQEVTSVSFSRDGLYALTSSRDGTAIIWLADDQWQRPAVAARAPD
jgi:WD40 repeat protein